MCDLQFDWNLARALAFSAVYFAREEYSPGGIVDDARCEDQDAPDPQESTEETMNAMLRYFRPFAHAIMEVSPQMERSKLRSAQQYSPGWAALQESLFKQYGPGMADTSRKIDRMMKMAGAATDRDILRGPGQESFRAVQGMLRESDPEFFAIREQTADQLADLLGSGLTGAETEAIERKLARDRVESGISTPTGTNLIGEAMQFGDAARRRQLEGITAATSFLPSSRTGLDPTQVALGRPAINTGDSKFLGVQQPASAESMGNNFFNQIAGFQQSAMDINAQKRDWIDRVNEGFSSVNI